MSAVLLVAAFWSLAIAALVAWRGPLLRRTWREPYLAHPLLVIESDDWGPGPAEHAGRLRRLVDMLAAHRDADGKPAVLTAYLVLTVPDRTALRRGEVARCGLEGHPEMLGALRDGAARGLLAPALHGLDHLHLPGLARLVRTGDPGPAAVLADPTAWEELPSPLQAHYVDGTTLPTRPVPPEVRKAAIAEAQAALAGHFGRPAEATAAPCYLWDDEVEALWAAHGIRTIATAGYRCNARDGDGRYLQDRRGIRTGHRSPAEPVYLVRNVFWEPADGRTLDQCLRELRGALREATPVIVYTHRYNYVRDEPLCRAALEGLDTLLTEARRRAPDLRFTDAVTLGRMLADGTWPRAPLARRLAAFLVRLWHRHRKLRLAACATGLILPGAAVVALGRLAGGRAR